MGSKVGYCLFHAPHPYKMKYFAIYRISVACMKIWQYQLLLYKFSNANFPDNRPYMKEKFKSKNG